MSSSGVYPGVGDCIVKNGILWGRGDISMLLFMGPGEEDGRGGVVAHSIYGQNLNPNQKYACDLPRPSNVPNRLDVKRDRRGVGN